MTTEDLFILIKNISLGRMKKRKKKLSRISDNDDHLRITKKGEFLQPQNHQDSSSNNFFLEGIEMFRPFLSNCAITGASSSAEKNGR